jgi:hypothetical protein
VVQRLPSWARLAIGLARAWEQARAQELEQAGQPDADRGDQGPSPRFVRPPLRSPAGSPGPAGTESRAEPSGEPESSAPSSAFRTLGDRSSREKIVTAAIDSSLEGLSRLSDDPFRPFGRAVRTADRPAAQWHGSLGNLSAGAVALAAGAAIAWTVGADHLRLRLIRSARGRPA